jgi:hypothetical protein
MMKLRLLLAPFDQYNADRIFIFGRPTQDDPPHDLIPQWQTLFSLER